MVADLLARIDEVDWASQRHAYGPAGDIPALLTALATADRRSRRRALAELAIRVLHLGRCAPVAATVAPFVIELAVDSEVRGRGAMFVLLGNLANAGDPGVRGELVAHRDDLVAALSDRAADVRAGALYALAALPAGDDEVQVRRRLTDADAGVRAAARLALAVRGIDADDPAGDAEPVERFAAAAAAAMMGRARLDEARELIGALVTRARQPLPWNDGDAATMALSLLELVGVDVLIAALAEIPDGDRERRLAVFDLAEILLRVAPDEPAVGDALRARDDVWTASRIVRAARAAGVVGVP